MSSLAGLIGRLTSGACRMSPICCAALILILTAGCQSSARGPQVAEPFDTTLERLTQAKEVLSCACEQQAVDSTACRDLVLVWYFEQIDALWQVHFDALIEWSQPKVVAQRSARR